MPFVLLIHMRMADRDTLCNCPPAQARFGWQWREDWHAWCPPGWPALTGIASWHGERNQQPWLALHQHGGVPYACAGGIGDRGQP